MESIQQHLCITGVCLMTLLEKAAIKMAFSELHKHRVFVNSFFFPSSCNFLCVGWRLRWHSGRNCHVSGCIVWGELWWLILHALGALERFLEEGCLSSRAGTLIYPPLCSYWQHPYCTFRMRRGRLWSAWFCDWAKIRLWHPRFRCIVFENQFS